MVKIVTRLLAGVHLAAAVETLALGIRAGAEPERLFEVIASAASSSWICNDCVPRILAGNNTARSAMDIFVKDLGIVLDTGWALTLPIAAAAHPFFFAVSAAGYGARDHAFIIRFWQGLAGIALPGPIEAGSTVSGESGARVWLLRLHKKHLRPAFLASPSGTAPLCRDFHASLPRGHHAKPVATAQSFRSTRIPGQGKWV